MSDEVRERVLDVLRKTWGFRWVVTDLSTATGYAPDVLYPVLAELERSGEVTSGWLPGPAPRRRGYEARRDVEADTVLVDTGTYFVRVPKKQEGS